jgi:hypothetical protein
MTSSGNTEVELLTMILSLRVLNPATAGTGREKIVSKYLFNTWPVHQYRGRTIDSLSKV